MPYEPVYRGLAQQPEYAMGAPSDLGAEPAGDQDIVMIAAIIVVVGVTFVFVARHFLATQIIEGPVLTLYPDRNADASQIENEISAVKTLIPQE